MIAHGRPFHLAKRQTDDPLNAPTNVSGIGTGVTVVNTDVATATDGLQFDSSATVTSQSAPQLAPTNNAIPVITTTTTEPSSTSTPEPTEVAAASTSKPIALSTVIGSCVGAFIGATALIVLGFWFYRRYSQSLKKRINTRGPLNLARNITADEHRRRSRLEPWNKLEDGDDKWEGMYQTKETKDVDQVAPMEKLGMFKKTPSVRTAYTHKSADVSAFDFPQSYADFDPNLAQTLSSSQTNLTQPRPFIGRAGENPTSSWDSETIASKSYLSVRTVAGGGAMSPTLHMAIPTPALTESQAHRWESAEVVQYTDTKPAEAEVAKVEEEEGDQRRSIHNPFFNARDDDTRGRSRANSGAKSPKAKGKEKMRYSDDPFDDIHSQLPKPYFVQHAPTSSTASTESKEKALQSLIAALEIPEDEVRDRLRIASMQPSLVSEMSSVGGYDEDVTKEFPLPPQRNGGSSQQS